ncbi:MAG: VanZ family protein [Clostridium celatum]|nr:VanZ family protein [Clostridium celatum]MDU2121790.1 VanZ family protein [Clostridium celatum]MDU4979681.1 VanZ family protein [Clostridium celatum]
MRISAVIQLARQYMLLGIISSIVIVTLFLIGYFLVYRKLMKGTKKLKASKVGLWSIFLIYMIVVLGATIGDRVSGYESINLQLFSSYKDVYNNFSLGEWRNIILNILMFVPIGFMIPLIFKKCERCYITYLVGFGITLFIEILQLVSKRGIFELDDIINNSLGCAIGYGIVMLFISLFKRKKVNQKYKALITISYQIPLIVSIIFISMTFIKYDKQELGNLPITNSYNINMSKIDISTKLNLDNESKKAYVYETYVGDKEDAINLANKIFSNFDTNIDESQNDEYDDTIVFKSEKGDYSLWVNYKGLTTWFTDFSQLEVKGAENLSYTEIQALLSKFDIELPIDADFKDNGDGNYSISLNMVKSKDMYLNGELICTISKNGIVSNFTNNIISYKSYKEYDILSLKEAYDEILKGNFRLIGMVDKISNINITDASLIYQLDSKGFYQPVYDFTANIDGNINHHIYISALKNN